MTALTAGELRYLLSDLEPDAPVAVYITTGPGSHRILGALSARVGPNHSPSDARPELRIITTQLRAPIGPTA